MFSHQQQQYYQGRPVRFAVASSGSRHPSSLPSNCPPITPSQINPSQINPQPINNFLDLTPATLQPPAKRQKLNPETPKPPILKSYDFKYVEPCNKLDRFLCPICIHPAVNPVAVACCGETFCDQCFKQTLNQSFNCPKCRTSITESIRIPNGFKDHFNELMVSCQDCNAVYSREKYTDHWLNHCMQPCPNQCGQSLSRKELSSHVASCPLSEIVCDYPGCNHIHLYQFKEQHRRECDYGKLSTMKMSEILTLATQQLKNSKSHNA